MKDSSRIPQPYQQLGEQLKSYRLSTKESLAEASNALELEEKVLARFEAGFDRPDEDLLYLLINHYRLQEANANRLWQLAGYDLHYNNDDPLIEAAMSAAKQLIMVIAQDNRTLYTDAAHIDCGPKGIQLTFSQSLADNKSITVARLGMSYPQAEELMNLLSVALIYAKYATNYRLLSPGK